MPQHLRDLFLDIPAPFALVERRLAGRALDVWMAGAEAQIVGFEDHSLIIADPGGAQRIVSVGNAVCRQFGLVPGQQLERAVGLAAELCAACDLIALRPQPVPFDAGLVGPDGSALLLRGVALPIDDGRLAQIVLSWREVLNRAATAQLRRELTEVLRFSARKSPKIDPFS